MKIKLLLLLWCVLCFSKIYAQNLGTTFKNNGITYKITSVSPDFTVCAIDYDESQGTDIIIPQSVVQYDNSYTVTTIGDGAFARNSLTSVVLPDSVISIGNHAFRQNALTSVVLPNSVTSIGDLAFYINVLSSVVMPESLISIGNSAFRYNKLTSVEFSDLLTSIGDYAFEGNSLTSIVLPNLLKTIGRAAFRHNKLLSVEFPDSLTTIGSLAFNWNDITSVAIPDSVTEIGRYSFSNNNVSKMVYNTRVPVVLNRWNADFLNKASVDLIVPLNTTESYLNAGWTGFRSITEEASLSTETVDGIGTAFKSNGIIYKISSVSPDFTVSAIDYDGSLGTDITIPETVIQDDVSYVVTTIGAGVFYDKGLTSVVIPNSVSNIGTNTFSNNSLKSVTLSNSLTSIGREAFWDNSLTSVVIPNSVTSIGSYAFYSNYLTSVVLPDLLTSIENSAFASNSLTSIDIPDSVTTIGLSAFWGNSLTNIVIPNSIKDIGNSSFGINNVNKIVSKSKSPAVLIIWDTDFFKDRSTIDLIVPLNTTQAYLDAGWTGFKSITEQETLSTGTIDIDDIFIAISNNTLNVMTGNNLSVVGVKIYTITGVLVKDGSQSNIDVTCLSSGVYVVIIKTNKGFIHQKIVL